MKNSSLLNQYNPLLGCHARSASMPRVVIDGWKAVSDVDPRHHRSRLVVVNQAL